MQQLCALRVVGSGSNRLLQVVLCQRVLSQLKCGLAGPCERRGIVPVCAQRDAIGSQRVFVISRAHKQIADSVLLRWIVADICRQRNQLALCIAQVFDAQQQID